MSVPIEEFDKEDLIKILHWTQVEIEKEQICKRVEQELRMQEMFAEARR